MNIDNGQGASKAICGAVIAARGILYRDGGVLVIRRQDNKMWEFPGGKKDSPQHVFIRSALEDEFLTEVGIPVHVPSVPVYQWDSPAGLPPKYPLGTHYQCTCYIVYEKYPSLKLVPKLNPEEHEEWRIVSLPEGFAELGAEVPHETLRAADRYYIDYMVTPRVLIQRGAMEYAMQLEKGGE